MAFENLIQTLCYLYLLKLIHSANSPPGVSTTMNLLGQLNIITAQMNNGSITNVKPGNLIRSNIIMDIAIKRIKNGTPSAQLPLIEDNFFQTTSNILAESNIQSWKRTAIKHLRQVIDNLNTFCFDLLDKSSETITTKTLNVGNKVKVTTYQFKTLGIILSQLVTSSTWRQNTVAKVVSATISGSPSNDLELPVTITFKLNNQLSASNQGSPICVYWNTSASVDNIWSPSGCNASEYNQSHVVCQCDHLTSFSVLLQPLPVINSVRSVRISSYIGSAISITWLVITLICYSILWKKTFRIGIIISHTSIAISLLLLNTMMVIGIDKELVRHSRVGCVIIGAILHYFVIYTFCWMLTESIIIYITLKKLTLKPIKVHWYFLANIGLVPFVVVGTTMAILGDSAYGDGATNANCWMNTDGNYSIFALAAPGVVIIMIIIIYMSLTLKSLLTLDSFLATKNEKNKVKASLRALAVLLPLLGIGWLGGPLAFSGATTDIAAIIFAVITASQGILVFILHVVLDPRVFMFLMLYA
ncbi:uncharacterized protein TRIADDRAFT_52069 [Trichoplax adhaerens]|uniref:G-protein coupled receptors family 2 profile 2 domain-containing protein n=1 Tax=Trichoplax adhaerens TaxID=10228 RepID=B3RLN8_TRIAD|nr:predicted protein [Trichoplax adhaerens]EDV29558.1 predicted protein [Trichoplax adhaerens]|eukprot:XP_002108760.1 predicted protein [Trichoplax adhaerens]